MSYSLLLGQDQRKSIAIIEAYSVIEGIYRAVIYLPVIICVINPSRGFLLACHTLYVTLRGL